MGTSNRTRIFFSTGEASGEQIAVLLAQEMQQLRPGIVCEGFGGERMEQAGFLLRARTTGWASMGPLAAIRRIPKLLVTGVASALRLLLEPPDVLVLIDFGAFNLRLAELLRFWGFKAPIVYCFPPGAWLDKPSQAQKVARLTRALVPFTHQRDFYLGLGLTAEYVGHPLLSVIPSRPPRPPAPPDGGMLAFLPGSRDDELLHHLPLMLQTFRRLREKRPKLTVTIVAADTRLARRIAAETQGVDGLSIQRGTRSQLVQVDAALVKSGTSVLEAALMGVPCVSMYVLSDALARIARRVWHGRYVTLPNLVLDRQVVPEFLQDAATPVALAAALEAALLAPERQLADYHELRVALGDTQTLAKWAAFVLAQAKAKEVI